MGTGHVARQVVLVLASLGALRWLWQAVAVVRGIPTLLVFKGGQVKEQIVGYVPKETIQKAIRAIDDQFLGFGQVSTPP